jgi:hypothetical protein
MTLHAKELDMTATLTNGKPRRQLADQLDRLEEQLHRQDSIIDALAEGLNQAVADAAKEGTKEAVTAAVIELLTNVELRAALHKATGPATVARPSAWEKLKAHVRQAAGKAKSAVSAAKATVAAKIDIAKAALAGATAPVWLAWRLRKAALVGLGVGVLVAGIAYATSHGFAAALSGVGAMITTIVLQGGLWLRRTVRRLTLA